MSMTIDPTRPGPVGEDRAGSALGRVLGRLRRAGPPERMRILTIGRPAIRVAVPEGAPRPPPLLPCHRLGLRPEPFQPVVGAPHPPRPPLPVAMPGHCRAPAPRL